RLGLLRPKIGYNTGLDSQNTVTMRYDLAALGALLLAAGSCFFRVGQVGMNEHECYLAQTSREMLSTGDWIVPHYSTMPRLRKTPLGYWSVAATALLTGRGVNEWTARLPSALAAIGTLVCVWQLARMIYGSRAAAVAAWLGASSAAVLFYSHQAVVDMQLT